MGLKMAAFWCAVLVCLSAAVHAFPTISVTPTVNLGSPITVQYSMTDGRDGRMTAQSAAGSHGNGVYLSKTGSDWIGLFKKGDCKSPQNNQDRHKCFLHWYYIPPSQESGTITFYQEHYKTAGEYEVRYFYGDNPSIPGAYHWLGQGWVCEAMGSYNVDSPDCTRTTYNAPTTLPAAAGLYPYNSHKGPCEHDKLTTKIVSTENTGTEGKVRIMKVTLNQCQCNANAASQTIDGVTIDHATCMSYRAACGRCALDAVATSNTVTITGAQGVDTYQDMKAIPGFEIGFP